MLNASVAIWLVIAGLDAGLTGDQALPSAAKAVIASMISAIPLHPEALRQPIALSIGICR